MGESPRLLTDFSARSLNLDWRIVNDNVMGGRSTGEFVVAEDILIFSGRTNTDGGGFSSIRTRAVRLDLADFTGIRIRIKGDGRRYTWRLRTDARWRGRQINFSADFETLAGQWQTIDLPFADFTAGYRGYALDWPPPEPGEIGGMGLILYDQLDGPFEVRLDSVRAY